MFMTGYLSLVCLAFNVVAFKETVHQEIEKEIDFTYGAVDSS